MWERQRATRLVPATETVGLHTVELANGASLRARTVVVASGARWRQMDVPGEAEHRNKGVTYCPHCDGPLFKGKRVAVIGGGNSGVEAAIDLAGLAAQVTVVELDDQLRADAVLQRALDALPNTSVVLIVRTTEVRSDGSKVVGLAYEDRTTGELRSLDHRRRTHRGRTSRRGRRSRSVADHGHFGRAAEACYVSQPTLSTQIKKLERELGVELVERSTRGANLTPAGQVIVQSARAILVEVDGIRAIAKRAADPEAATLRIGLFPTLAPYLLPHVVPAIHARFPKLELLLSEEKTETVLDRIRDGQLDAGVLALPIRGDRLVVAPLFDEDFVLVVPSDHPLAGAADEPVRVAVLAGERLLLLEEGHCLRDHALAVCQLAGATERRGFRATGLETLRQMVAGGVGMTLLPELALRAPVLPSPAVAVRRFVKPAPSRRVARCWRPRRRRPRGSDSR